MNRIITISRQFGSGGRTIAKEVASRLGIPCYDSELIEKIAEESGYTPEYIKEIGEYTVGKTGLSNILAARDKNGHSNYDNVFIAQAKVINRLAAEGPCVIVGRCADYILREKADCLKVFIQADNDFRCRRTIDLYGERTEKPEKRLIDKDKKRVAYYKTYTDMEWGKIENYDLVLSSSAFGIEKCAEIIASLY